MVKNEKFKKCSFEWYQKIFNETKEDQSRIVNKRLYKELYDFYKKYKNLDINIEKITLKKKIGHYKGQGTNLNLQLMVIALTILINSVIQIAGVTFHTVLGVTSGIWCFIISMIMFAFIVTDSVKSKSKEKNFIYCISLQVLEDIEKERNEERKRVAEEFQTLLIEKLEQLTVTFEKDKINMVDNEIKKGQEEVAVTKQESESKNILIRFISKIIK
ncbi:hypothetical protein LGK95_01265 [Clostridium algoriphilum]|uniref:hypothetical protein n=1 Tax=Clostridium algoriphilum TaxID=198347 RepID=UPI001CF296EA|nr:hypothetical protein [Clostridium algoriphilum]MCB2292165.1 hypothetical protein [Clostridium algoriphilum]